MFRLACHDHEEGPMFFFLHPQRETEGDAQPALWVDPITLTIGATQFLEGALAASRVATECAVELIAEMASDGKDVHAIHDTMRFIRNTPDNEMVDDPTRGIITLLLRDGVVTAELISTLHNIATAYK